MSRDDRRRRRRKSRRKRARRRRFVVAGFVTIALLAAMSVKLRLIKFQVADPASCVTQGVESTTFKMKPEQAAIATTIAATAKRLRLPNRAVTVGLATAWQESGMRNLNYGDLDSLGVFQQRPSKGWGNKRQLQNPKYAASAFFTNLAVLPNWQTMSINDAAQAVQRSGFPKAYGKWEVQSRAMARAFTGEVPAAFTCRYGPVRTFMDQSVYDAMREELGTTGTSFVAGGPNGWTVSSWLVARARQYSIHTVSYGGYRWSVRTGVWQYTGAVGNNVTFS